ncbi:urea carboxylase [Yersinia entomophaga]|uniref:Biotin carboxylase n=1 Tax=Yersinia entomophaga TaxID=935293 RepID=B6A888_YERET|nr:urea carboxylase [Yersinia entomophaga]ABG33858.1 Yen9 [Yersinia entomophaga]ANI28964.1 urea carboxylase [Yersinia entomophaga]
MFNSVLIANRGEIAVRAIRTLKNMGITSVAVYSDPDANAQHVIDADIAVALGGDKASDSYLDIDKILAAARQSGAEAIFPGYGFLSERAEFAQACEDAGIVFIGPTAEHIASFGLKHRARALAAAVAMPMTPGTSLLATLREAQRAAEDIGYPVMLKTTAGGGGIGLMRCDNEGVLVEAWDSVKRMGQQFFSDDGVFIERFIDRARHLEVQIFGDGKGRVVALGERDCSLQRRNQKVVEETPAPNLPQATREALYASAIALGESVNYRSVGTVEFIYDAASDAFYFLEVNTRLQVEHPVTESVTGLDLIECMLKIAAGDALDWERMVQPPRGASIEVRLYAEDALKNFQPAPGVLTEVCFPENVRVDSWVSSGSEVSVFYDPMIAKIIVHGQDRHQALERLVIALNTTRLHGIPTNLDYLRQIIGLAEFKAGVMWTRLLDSVVYQAHSIEVLEPGTWSSVQDCPGRLGYWDIGVPPSGPMDDFAFRLANRIVGNHPSSAGMEFTLQGPTLRFHCDATIALTGADCPAALDGRVVPYWQPLIVKAGQILTLGRATRGCRTYLAVRYGLDVPVYLGSRSTFALGQFGGHAGRTLRVADILAISRPDLAACTTPAPIALPQIPEPALIPQYGDLWEIGVLNGPHGAPDLFTAASMETFFASEWLVHYNSNRLGVRLVGPKPEWARADGGEAGLHPSNVHDCQYAIGSVNFTGDFPVILTQDGPSLGGFVCPVTIAKAELWKVGQVKPGDRIRFRRVTFEQAQSLASAQDAALADLQAMSAPVSTGKVSPIIEPIHTRSAAILAELPAHNQCPAVIYRQAGDNYILIEYGDNLLDLAMRLRIYLLMQAITQSEITGIEELSPGVRSLQVRYDSQRLTQSQLMALLLGLEQTLEDVTSLKVPSRIVHLPMAFEDSATLAATERYQQTVRAEAPWLPNNVDFIQRINGLSSREKVKQILFASSYLILGLGDVYLGAPCAVPLDPRHRLLSSKYNPARTWTAEGAVGIGGMYMCIYGIDSPGGYQLVGRTLPIWNKFLKNEQFGDEPWLLKFFDQVRFYPVTEEELTAFRRAFREGRAQIQIEEVEFDFATYSRFLMENADDIAAFRQRQQQAFNGEVAHWQAQESAAVESAMLAEAEITEDPDGHLVSADLNGNIWKILVEPGQWVKQGEPLIVVEAMKMELMVVSPYDGTVMRIHCQQGRAVEPGDALLWLDIAS